MSDLDELIKWFDGKRASDPVWEDEKTGTWHIFGYAEATSALADHGTFSSDLSDVLEKLLPDRADYDALTRGNILIMDPPDHNKLRKLVSKGFTPRFVAELAPRIEGIVKDLFDRMRDAGEIDLVADFAYPLPVTVIAELLGTPAADHHLFEEWAERLIANADGSTAVRQSDVMLTVARTIGEMSAYVQEHLRERRTNPRDDLISRLAVAEADGQRLADEEIGGLVSMLLRAGHLTTTLLIGNIAALLSAHPDTAALLRREEGLLSPAIEETLRHRPSVITVMRRTAKDAVFDGRTIPAGRMVTIWIGSANRDERRFPNPHDFDVRRQPNQHLSFALGGHFCLGAPLARLEAKIAMRAMLGQWREMSVGPDAEFYDPKHFVGAKRLPLAVDWV
jgi:cytochrome P450